MKYYIVNRGPLVVLAAVLTLPVAPAFADEVRDLVSPDVTEVTVGVQNHTDPMPAILRQYTGLKGGADASLDLQFIKRSDEGLWLKAYALDLNLPTKSFGAQAEQQGKWKLSYEHDDLLRIAPYTVSSKVQGVGTGKVTLNQDFRASAGGQALSNLELKRVRNGLGAVYVFRPDLRLNLGARLEDKSGAIMTSSIGSTINNPLGNGKNYGAMFFTPQPEDYRHRQLDASLDYAGKKLQLSLGYYGSYFDNNNLALQVTPGYNSLPAVPATAAPANGNVAIPTGNYAIPWISLPPDNRSHQLFLAGGYSFSNATRLTFKLARMSITQDDAFIPSYGAVPTAQGATETAAAYAARVLASGYYTLNPPGVPYAAGITATSLHGDIVTSSYAATLTSRLSPKVDVKVSFRHQNRDDRTPQLRYMDATASAEYPNGRLNELDLEKDTRAALEVGVRLPAQFGFRGFYDYQKLERPDTMREETTEHTFKLQLQRAVSESVNGWLIYSVSRRGGGAWALPDATPSTGSLVTFSTATAVAAPLQFVDRDRNKLRAMVDFAPSTKVSGQFYYEIQRDTYPFVPPSGNARMGITRSSSELIGADIDVQLGRRWHANAWFNYDLGKSHQNELYTPRPAAGDQNCAVSPTRTFTLNCSPWQADLGLRGRVFGAALNGKAFKKIDVLFDYMYSKDDTHYNIGFDPLYPASPVGSGSSVPAGAGVLPDTRYTINRLRLIGTYPVGKATKVRASYVFDERRYDDYQWTGWSFTDGTRVLTDPRQRDQMVALSVLFSL